MISIQMPPSSDLCQYHGLGLAIPLKGGHAGADEVDDNSEC